LAGSIVRKARRKPAYRFSHALQAVFPAPSLSSVYIVCWCRLYNAVHLKKVMLHQKPKPHFPENIQQLAFSRNQTVCTLAANNASTIE
jgi:hypothetical protein